jgi:hypothetical protein
MRISDSTESDGNDDSEHHLKVDIRIEEDVDAPDSIDSAGDVDKEWHGANKDVPNKEKEDEEEEGQYEAENKDAEDNMNEDDGKEPRTIGQGEMVKTLAYNVDTMI